MIEQCGVTGDWHLILHNKFYKLCILDLEDTHQQTMAWFSGFGKQIVKSSFFQF